MEKRLGKAATMWETKILKDFAYTLGEDIASTIAIIKMELGTASPKEENVSLKDQLLESLAQSLEKIRQLSNQIYPPSLERFGLLAAIKSAKLDKRFTIEIVGSLSHISHYSSLLIFRVIQAFDSIPSQGDLAYGLTIHATGEKLSLYFDLKTNLSMLQTDLRHFEEWVLLHHVILCQKENGLVLIQFPTDIS